MNYPSTHTSLLEKIQNGNDICWNEFYYRYSPIIKYAGRFYNFSESECDDLAQNVMLKFFDQSKKFTYRAGDVKFRTYFATIIRSQAIDYIRKNKKNFVEQLDWSVSVTPFEERFQQEWNKFILEEALDELRTRVDHLTYQAFELYGMQNRSPQEVSGILNCSKNQLYVAKSRCVKILKEIIDRQKKTDGDLNIELPDW